MYHLKFSSGTGDGKGLAIQGPPDIVDVPNELTIALWVRPDSLLLIECTFTLKPQTKKCHLCTRLAPPPPQVIISNLSMRQLLLISKRLSSVHGIILLFL
jgi:hypothetical protein